MCNDWCPFFNYPAEMCPVPCPYDGPDDHSCAPDDVPIINDEELKEYYAQLEANESQEDFYLELFIDE